MAYPSEELVTGEDTAQPPSDTDLAETTRKYYQQSPSDAEDENWGAGVARDRAAAWDQD